MVKGSTKEKVWFEEYFVDFNATAAARRAKYKHPNVMGPRKKKKFADEIAERLKEKALTAEEALSKLSEQATGSIEPFVEFQTVEKEDPETGEVREVYTGEYWIDLGQARDAGLLHLVKEMKQDKRVTHYDDGTSEVTYRTKVKLHDAQRALVKILDHHDAGDPNRASQHVVMSLDEWKEEAERRRQEVEETMDMFGEGEGGDEEE